MNSVIVLVGRILLSAIFILSGFGKLTDISGTAAYFAMFHLPATTLVAVGAGLIELFGGLAILVGFQTRTAAWVLALFSIASALIAHMNWADTMQLINFEKNLAIAGGFLLLAIYGPGALSVDALRGVKRTTA
ncbi:DoxX family protein [Mesorhizobium sp. ANAO-SY3R2]|uniref:DoxX family protein n=1 Tax=Mesorhizobium sp. ANAO-SY3R2 TaxID=3166644 RepID=UPI00366AD58C